MLLSGRDRLNTYTSIAKWRVGYEEEEDSE